MKLEKLLNLIVGVFCFILALFIVFDTLALVPCIIIFWLSGLNIGVFISELAMSGGARSQDPWYQNKSGKERRPRDKCRFKK